MNQLHNVHNYNQGDFARVLFVCSAGLLRSATAAHTFSAAPYDWNTRTAGAEPSYALNPVTEGLLEWASWVVCMGEEHQSAIQHVFGQDYDHKFVSLDIPDIYSYRQPSLVKSLHDQIDVLLDENYKFREPTLDYTNNPLDDEF
jgi:predicted protein tyrosine phosphatase